MPLVSSRKGFRTAWMFPRNIRYIEPWKLSCILSALTSLKNPDMGSRKTQDLLYAFLAEYGVKRSSQARDKNDGGMRTYYAQMGILGLTYGKQRALTVAGKTLLEGRQPLHVLQTQLLRLQYPSAYSQGQNVKIHPEIKVKPFIFILDLLQHPQIGSLSVFELMIPVVYGHSHSSLNFCISKILELRKRNAKTLNDIEDLFSDDSLYLPRGGWTWGDSPSLAQKIKQLENIRDIANTAGNYLKAAQLVYATEEAGGKVRYEYNADFENIYQSEKNFKFIDASASEETFQRHFGRYDKAKDTAKVSTEKASGLLTFIQTLYLNEKKKKLFAPLDSLSFADEQSKQWGISKDCILDTIASLTSSVSNLQHDLYLDYSNSGTEHALDFEKATVEILKSLGFDATVHIGQEKARSARRGGYPDICIKCSTSSECGLADTKASNVFVISDTDELKLKEYYRDSNKDFFPDSTLTYYLYIAGNFKKTMSTYVKNLSKELGFPVTALRARALLSLYERDARPSVEELLDTFKSGTVIEHC